MRKTVTMFILLVSFCIVFAGAVAAVPEVEVEVVEENSDPVTVTSPGDEVDITANATTDEYLDDPAVILTLDPESGLTVNDEEAVMIYDGGEYQNDPADPFFYWDDQYGWVWWIGWVYGDQLPGEVAQLFVPATVSDIGEITVNAEYYQWPAEATDPILLDTDSYTFLSVAQVSGETVPMQDTGTPLAVAALGLISIVGGTVYGKLR
ncbi:MAG: hypothetical protein LUQ24_02930 [Methanobacterium sp.]|nr:hypothetical protein [Methanobacterium sp.]